MITGDKEYLEQICTTHVCPEHGPKLCVAWHAGENNYVIRCGAGHFPEEVTRELTPMQEYKAGEREAHTQIMELIPRKDLGTDKLLSAALVEALSEYAIKYGLDPDRAHVVMMYSKPYITLDGYLYYANRSGIPYSLTSRPMTTGEIKDYKLGKTDHGWLAEVNFLDSGARFTAPGIVTYEEMTARSPRDESKLRSPVVATHPWQLAQKRAEWQTMRRAFPVGGIIEREGKVPKGRE